jgi:hypothetical protein
MRVVRLGASAGGITALQGVFRGLRTQPLSCIRGDSTPRTRCAELASAPHALHRVGARKAIVCNDEVQVGVGAGCTRQPRRPMLRSSAGGRRFSARGSWPRARLDCPRRAECEPSDVRPRRESTPVRALRDRALKDDVTRHVLCHVPLIHQGRCQLLGSCWYACRSNCPRMSSSSLSTVARPKQSGLNPARMYNWSAVSCTDTPNLNFS